MSDKTTAKLRQIQLQQDYAQCFGTEAGKRVLEDLQKRYTLQPAFKPIVVQGENGNASELKYCPYYAAMRDGGRQVVLEIEANAEIGKLAGKDDISPEERQKLDKPRTRKAKTKPTNKD